MLTVRAARLLTTADVVFHDDLVPDEVLGLVHRSALVTSVGKRFGRLRITREGINALMIESARGAVRGSAQEWGPAGVWACGGRNCSVARGQISFVVVPGVTAALAAGALLGLPLTDRRSASKLIFCTGHHAAAKADSTPIWSGPLPEGAVAKDDH